MFQVCDKLLLREALSVVLRSWKQSPGPGLTEKNPSREVSEVLCLANNSISQPLAVRCGHIARFKTKSYEQKGFVGLLRRLIKEN